MRKRSRKRPADFNSLAAAIVGEAATASETDAGKDPLAVELGRRGGKKGGKARADAMSAEDRSAAAKKAANARWGKKP